MECAQANRLDNLAYIVISEEGPQQNRTFTIKVMIGDIEYGIGREKNKKTAGQAAANSALLKITASKN